MLAKMPAVPSQTAAPWQTRYRTAARPCCCRQHTLVVAGLKKQHKKLSKLLKTHGRRLEHMLSAIDDHSTTGSLQQVVHELRTLNTNLEQLVKQPTGHAHGVRIGCGSSSSSSDSEDLLSINDSLATQPPLTGPVLANPASTSKGTGTSGRVLVCQGSKCAAKGALEVLHTVSGVGQHLDGVDVLPCKCLGKCKLGPAVSVRRVGEKPTVYTEVDLNAIPGILAFHFSEEMLGPSSAPVLGTVERSNALHIEN